MAEKKTSQAQKAASKASSGTKKTGSTKTASGKKINQQPEAEQIQIPVRLISAVVCLTAFIVLLVMFLQPGGALLDPIHNLILGLFGQTTYYISIPAVLYLFIIQAFSGGRPVKMRSICLGCFVFVCGMISHLAMENSYLVGWDLKALWTGGIAGNTAGILCGSLAMLFSWLLTETLTYIILIVAAIFTLLGAMQITIPSLIRAIENRPRAEWEEEEKEARQEPAALVVNHLATKRIEHIENKRKRQAEMTNVDIPLDGELDYKPDRRKLSSKAKKMLNQIDADVLTPVSAAGEHVSDEPDDSIFTPVGKPKKEITEDIPKMMPPLEIQEPPVPAPAPQIQPAEETVATVAKEKVTAKDALESAAIVAEEIALNAQVERPVYCYPPIDLLYKARSSGMDATAEMRENTTRLNETLASFKIEARIINVTRGPSVTRYEVELDKGVRLNKLTTIADDIALSLGASGVRIAAIPGKISVVGIEVPNRTVTTVSLRDVIDSNEFSKAKSKSSFAVGKDIGGTNIIGNIAKLPHMLIAGTTGSGKSVCMNSIIISLLYKASPEDVKLIMIDPKMVELGIYNGIPHLLIPVVTDPKKAAGSLQWAVTEMMRRYKTMSDAGVRDLESYNSIAEHEEDGRKLPQVVVIIDELADLMLVAAKEVEESICRIAQMGRAAGIHLVIATQRPSADVITGLMKANIPSRIAFAVASAMESRIILDTQGAEKLVGKGDMLFSPIGSGKPLRVQGCFVSDPEVEAVASYVKDNYNTSYDQTVMDEIDKKAAQTGSGKPATASDPDPEDEVSGGDEMLPAAVDVFMETGQASVSMLQRRLKLGYARAARIVDEMEEKGIVGPFQGSKPRTILITKEQWESMKSGQPQQMAFSDMDDTAVPEEND